jgi:hypothetical protein
MRRMMACKSLGKGGRPGVDFHRHKSRKPWRCQRSRVTGFTITSTLRQSKKWLSQISAMRVASLARRGLTWRS